MKKKIVSVFLVIAMLSVLCVPAFALAPDDPTPPWVEEGETWYPANGIMLLEDFGLCPKGHEGPKGYIFQGYSKGQMTGHFDDLALIVTILSVASKNPIIIGAGTIGAGFLNWLHGKEDPNFTYFKYTWTSEDGGAPFIHIIYTYYEDGIYKYVTCETYYDI